MQRCPCCHARLSAAPLCPRCGADLSPVIRCEHLAKDWLGVSLQALNSGATDLAIAAVKRSLSYKQTIEAQRFEGFLVQHQYQALYVNLARKQWQDARQTITRLRILQGDNDALPRFQCLVDYLSDQAAPDK
jgi:hypothetical protein